MKRTDLTKYLSGTGIAAGILASGSAHGQIIFTSFTGLTVTESAGGGFQDDQYIEFSLDPIAASIGGGGEFELDTSGLTTSGAPKLAGDDTGIEVTATAVSTGTEIGSGTTFTSYTAPSDGLHQIFGLVLPESDGTHYGYVQFSQSTDVSGDLTETLEAIGVQGTPGVSISAGATPEPATTSLLAFGAMGAAGLMAYRRRLAA